MKRFRHPGWARRHPAAPVTAGYVAVALVLGFMSKDLRWFGGAISSVSSSSAIAILSAIASGMMALTAIVFSLLFVTLQFGGTAYSPRLVNELSRGSFLGHALGIFTGTFVYALLAIRTVDIAGSPGINMPVIILALVWMLASVAVLVLQLPRIRGLSIGDLLVLVFGLGRRSAMRVYRASGDREPAAHPRPGGEIARTIRHVGEPKYLVGLDEGALASLAAEVGAVLFVHPAIGDAVVSGDPLIDIIEPERPMKEATLRRALWLGKQRTLVNDPAYAIRLLVDVAIRALSPAVNDPTTAVTVLDKLDGLLRLLAWRNLEDNALEDKDGRVVVVRAFSSWDDFVSLALSEIHFYGRDSVQVQRRLATLVRDLDEVLPDFRRPAIERLARWRLASLPKILHDGEAWTDPSALDRQGLGHPQMH